MQLYINMVILLNLFLILMVCGKTIPEALQMDMDDKKPMMKTLFKDWDCKYLLLPTVIVSALIAIPVIIFYCYRLVSPSLQKYCENTKRRSKKKTKNLDEQCVEELNPENKDLEIEQKSTKSRVFEKMSQIIPAVFKKKSNSKENEPLQSVDAPLFPEINSSEVENLNHQHHMQDRNV